MLPVLEKDGRRTCRHIVGFSILLLFASTVPVFLGLSGSLYLAGALILGLGMLASAVALNVTRSTIEARRLLRASVLYLPLLLLLTVVDVSF